VVLGIRYVEALTCLPISPVTYRALFESELTGLYRDLEALTRCSEPVLPGTFGRDLRTVTRTFPCRNITACFSSCTVVYHFMYLVGLQRAVGGERRAVCVRAVSDC
jgi:hypothetical protein